VNKPSIKHAVCSTLTTALALFGLLTAPAWAQETCETTGVEFGFFNGVQTQLDDAQSVVDDHLPELYGLTTPDGLPITYTLYYNDTDAGLADFVETFEQRLQEQEGLLAGRFELFFSTAPCGMPQSEKGLGHGSQGWAGPEPLPCEGLPRFRFLAEDRAHTARV